MSMKCMCHLSKKVEEEGQWANWLSVHYGLTSIVAVQNKFMLICAYSTRPFHTPTMLDMQSCLLNVSPDHILTHGINLNLEFCFKAVCCCN